MFSDMAVQVDNLSKCYQIFEKPRHRLLQILMGGRKRYFREFWALKNVSFSVRRGETVGILGRNGSGKSTLLQLICDTLSPTEGSIVANGRIAALLELGSGFHPDYTGRENVFMNGAILGIDKTEILSRFDEIAGFADIGDFMEQPVKTYSSGMLMRLAFAVQAMLSPDIFVVDEALSVGDEKFQRKCFARLENLKQQGASILLVSHSGQQIMEFCDRAILLERGECLLQAEPSEAFRAYQRILYSPAEDRRRFIDQLQNRAGAEPEPSALHGSGKDTGCRHNELDVFEESFDESLISETVLNYPEQGAKIECFEIKGLRDTKVNILISGNSYKFIVKGQITQKLTNVFIALHIKKTSGALITGQRYPAGNACIESVEPGTAFEVTFEFNIALLPELYFVGGGVWTESSTCAHRILDAMVFRVLPGKSRHSFGYCDLSNGAPKISLL